MTYAQFRELVSGSYGEINDILSSVLDRYSEDEEIDENDVYDAILDEVGEYFIYYSDAWDYLQDNAITDFEDAFYEWNTTDVCGIASYYLCEDARRYVGDEWSYYEDYEVEDEDAEI